MGRQERENEVTVAAERQTPHNCNFVNSEPTTTFEQASDATKSFWPIRSKIKKC
jgi:hypothetical protein